MPHPGKKTSEIKKSKSARGARRKLLSQRLAAYSAMATGVAGVSEAAHAELILFENINVAVPVGDTVFIDIENMTTVGNFVGADFYVSNNGFNTHWAPLFLTPYGAVLVGPDKSNSYDISYVPRLIGGSTVGDPKRFTSGGDYLMDKHPSFLKNSPFRGWAPGSTGYVGFRINLGGSDYQYGYVALSIDSAFMGDVTILSAALQTDVNTPVTLPAIPEPSSLALLAMGATGVAAFRRRREHSDAK